MIIRRYDHERDRDSLIRVHREVGWLGEGKEKEQLFDTFILASRGFVAELDGAAECGVLMNSGSMRYQQRELPFVAVGAVTTSRVARRQGLAGRATATALADAALRGAAVAGLSMFDQGFYDLLGFGTMGYEHWVTFDPATLRVPVRPRPPARITPDDAEAAHSGRLRRLRPHGGVSLDHLNLTRGGMSEADNGFGLGYRVGERITHHFWAEAKGESGPYEVWWLAYESTDQMLELLGLLHNLADQVLHVWLQEPAADPAPGPAGSGRSATAPAAAAPSTSTACGAMPPIRCGILDLPACIAAVEARTELAFNLELHDPVVRFLPEDGWRGISGEYRVRLGASSSAEPGSDPGLPTLRAGVGAFSRVWLGVRPAVSVAVTDDLSAPPELLADLDAALALPVPHFNWGF